MCKISAGDKGWLVSPSLGGYTKKGERLSKEGKKHEFDQITPRTAGDFYDSRNVALTTKAGGKHVGSDKATIQDDDVLHFEIAAPKRIFAGPHRSMDLSGSPMWCRS